MGKLNEGLSRLVGLMRDAVCMFAYEAAANVCGLALDLTQNDLELERWHVKIE